MPISTSEFNLARALSAHGHLHLEQCCNDRRPSVFEEHGFTNELYVIGLFLCRDQDVDVFTIIDTALNTICNGKLGKMASKLTELNPYPTIHTAEYLKWKIGLNEKSHDPTLTTFTAEDIKELWSQFENHSL